MNDHRDKNTSGTRRPLGVPVVLDGRIVRLKVVFGAHVAVLKYNLPGPKLLVKHSLHVLLLAVCLRKVLETGWHALECVYALPATIL